MFPKRLRQCRMKRGLTQQVMSELLNISLNAYQKYEQAERSPSFEILIHIADILDVSLDYLFGRDVFMKSHGVSADEFL